MADVSGWVYFLAGLALGLMLAIVLVDRLTTQVRRMRQAHDDMLTALRQGVVGVENARDIMKHVANKD